MLALIDRSNDGSGQLDTFKLPYYDESTGADAHVRLSRVKFVRTQVLDLCVFNPHGSAEFLTAAEAPSGLIPSWAARWARYVESLGNVLTLVRSLNNTPATALGAIVGDVKGSPFQASIPTGVGRISFNCERVGRLRDPLARALLSRFSQYFARDAEPHDFAGGPMAL